MISDNMSDYVKKDDLKKEVLKILMEDSDLEIIQLAEAFLLDCLKDAINTPEKGNSVIANFLEDLRNEVTVKCNTITYDCLEKVKEKIGSLQEYIEEVKNNYQLLDQQQIQDELRIIGEDIDDLYNKFYELEENVKFGKN